MDAGPLGRQLPQNQSWCLNAALSAKGSLSSLCLILLGASRAMGAVVWAGGCGGSGSPVMGSVFPSCPLVKGWHLLGCHLHCWAEDSWPQAGESQEGDASRSQEPEGLYLGTLWTCHMFLPALVSPCLIHKPCCISRARFPLIV